MALLGTAVGGSGLHGFGLSFSLVDNFSGTARRIGQSLGVLDAQVSSAATRMAGFQTQLALGTKLAGAGAVMGLAFVPAITKTLKLSDVLADVRKTTDLTAEGAINLRKALQSIDTRNDIFQLLDIARVGGQIGIATAELEGFTRSTNKIVVALGDEFTEGARQVATELGGIGKAFGIFEEMGIETGMLRIGNAINKLSQEGLATAPYLSNFTKRVAAMGRTANASVGDIIGMAAGFKEVNLPVERTSSGMERVFLKMGTDLNRFAQVVKLNTRVFRQEFEKNGIEALIMFAKALREDSPQ